MTTTPASPRRRPRASPRAGEAEHGASTGRARGLGVVGAPAGPKGRGRRPAGASREALIAEKPKDEKPSGGGGHSHGGGMGGGDF
jgi:hypothetical protein